MTVGRSHITWNTYVITVDKWCVLILAGKNEKIAWKVALCILWCAVEVRMQVKHRWYRYTYGLQKLKAYNMIWKHAYGVALRDILLYATIPGSEPVSRRGAANANALVHKTQNVVATFSSWKTNATFHASPLIYVAALDGIVGHLHHLHRGCTYVNLGRSNEVEIVHRVIIEPQQTLIDAISNENNTLANM